jgi:heptosyltransferase-2
MAAPHSLSPARILIRGVNWIGDAVMTIPALTRIREAFPDSHLALLTTAKLAPLYQHLPAVDQVIPVPPNQTVFSVASSLRRGQFTLGLAFPNSHRSALELWLARIPCRVGRAAFGRRWLLTHPVPPLPPADRMRKRTEKEVKKLVSSNTPIHSAQAPVTHHIHHYLELAAAVGADPSPVAPRLVVAREEVTAVCSRFHINPQDLWVGLNPGAEYGPAKRWPPERFADVAARITRRQPARWLIFGAAGGCALASSIEKQIQAAFGVSAALNVAGLTSLRELMALLHRCSALLTNDTGPMHLAAALGTRVVALFGSTSPAFTAPGCPGDSHHLIIRKPVPCSPCFRRQCPIDFRCMLNIQPEVVVSALAESLAFHPTGSDTSPSAL